MFVAIMPSWAFWRKDRKVSVLTETSIIVTDSVLKTKLTSPLLSLAIIRICKLLLMALLYFQKLWFGFANYDS